MVLSEDTFGHALSFTLTLSAMLGYSLFCSRFDKSFKGVSVFFGGFLCILVYFLWSDSYDNNPLWQKYAPSKRLLFSGITPLLFACVPALFMLLILSPFSGKLKRLHKEVEDLEDVAHKSDNWQDQQWRAASMSQGVYTEEVTDKMRRHYLRNKDNTYFGKALMATIFFGKSISATRKLFQEDTEEFKRRYESVTGRKI